MAIKGWEALKRFPTIEAKAEATKLKAEGDRRLDEANAKAIEVNAEANAERLKAEAYRIRAEADGVRADTSLKLQRIETEKLLVDIVIHGNNGSVGAIIYGDSHLQVQIGRGKPTSVKKAELVRLALPIAPESKTADHNGENLQGPAP